MDKPMLMRVLQPQRTLAGNFASEGDRKRALTPNHPLQVNAVNPFHGHEMPGFNAAGIGGGDKVWVLEMPHDSHLALEASQMRGVG
jgi:hypothetical protein